MWAYFVFEVTEQNNNNTHTKKRSYATAAGIVATINVKNLRQRYRRLFEERIAKKSK